MNALFERRNQLEQNFKAARVTALRRKERENQHWERMSNVIDG